MLPKKRPPTHPGEMLLKEFLEPLGVTQKEFAAHLGWTYARLNEIVNGRRGVTAESALAIGDALKTGPEFWLNLQRNWDIWQSMQHHKKVPPFRQLLLRCSTFPHPCGSKESRLTQLRASQRMLKLSITTERGSS
jgi:antitoxin HigA-1